MTSEVNTLFAARSEEDGVIRIEKWLEGYVLWYHGEIAWKSWAALSRPAQEPAPAVNALLARVASIICEETCGLTSDCKSREAAKALFDKGLLHTSVSSTAPNVLSAVTAAQGVEVELRNYCLILLAYIDAMSEVSGWGVSEKVNEIRAALAQQPLSAPTVRGEPG